jgi:hypothetical protein
VGDSLPGILRVNKADSTGRVIGGENEELHGLGWFG